MKHGTRDGVSQAPPGQPANGVGGDPARPIRCSICGRRLGKNIIFQDETGDVPEPRQSWTLCAECDEAVRAELERSPVQGPLRLRIAVGLVAAERGAGAVRMIRRIVPDDAWLPFLFWGFGVVMILHIFVLVWVVSLISR